MLPWNALPLNTIGIIISLSLLIPAIITILLLKIKRYEELGWIIGIFLVILSLITYSYLIPNEIIDNARIPEDYIWEDEGNVYYWERNSVFSPDELVSLPPTLADLIVRRDPIEKEFVGKEIIHVTEFNKHENKAVVHDAIYICKPDIPHRLCRIEIHQSPKSDGRTSMTKESMREDIQTKTIPLPAKL